MRRSVFTGRRRVAALGLMAAAATAAIAATTLASMSPRSVADGDGPLEFPVSYDVVLRPMTGDSFFVVEACLVESTGDVEVTEASADGGEVLVNFSRPSVVGAGSAADLATRFAPPASGVAGRVGSCRDAGPWVELAVVLPEAVEEDRTVDGFFVTYVVAGESYRERVDARFTTCASAPAELAQSACD